MHSQLKTSVAVLISISFALILPMALVLYVDPYQIYHKSFFKDVGISIEQRYQNAGIINSYLADPTQKYDSVLIGTSMSENFTRSKAAESFGWKKPLRLFLGGSYATEQVITLRHALATEKVKYVLWEFHPEYYQAITPQTPETAFPDYLYNNHYWDDARYVFNFDSLQMSLQLIRGKNHEFIYTIDDMGLFGEDATIKKSVNTKAFIDAQTPNKRDIVYRSCLANSGKQCTNEEIEQAEPWGLKYKVLPLLKQYCNQNIEFVLFIAPLPSYRYIGTNFVYSVLYMPRYILNTIAQCTNIRLHSFDTMDFTGDLNNYIDKQHYIPQINDKILELMGSRQNELTLENVQNYEREFIEKLNHYTIYTSYPAEPKF